MAGIFARLSTVFRSKANKALDKVEDPRETLDYSYQRQLDMLQKVRRGVADVATSRKRVELQMNQLQADVDKMQNAAARALEQGREDLAREALTRKATLQAQLNDLQTQHATLQAEEEKLIRGSQRLQARVDAFRTRKETVKATYSAAEAQTRINEAFTGLNEEMGDIGMAITRAVDELMASGAIEDPTRSYGDDITRELDNLASDHSIDAELSALKAQLDTGHDNSTPELESGSGTGMNPETGSRAVRRQEGQS